MSRRRLGQPAIRSRPVNPYAFGANPSVPSHGGVPGIDAQLLQDFRAKTAGTSALGGGHSGFTGNMANEGGFGGMASTTSSAVRQQQRMVNEPAHLQTRTLSARSAGASTGASEYVALRQKVEALSTTVQNWHQLLTEITQAVFVVLATSMVDHLPFYIELPTNKEDLRSPDGHLSAGEKVTLIYPQFTTSPLLFMRMRRCNPHTGGIEQFYVPVMNQSLSPKELVEYTGLTSSAEQYVDWFHNPGEDDPCPVDDDDLEPPGSTF